MDAQFLDFKLIDIAETQSILESCQGNNQQQVFICYAEEEKHLADFLAKILSAVQLNMQNDIVLWVKTKENNFSFGNFKRHSPTKIGLLFGLTPSSIGIHIDHQKYEPFTIDNTTFLIADSLTDLNTSKVLKLKLWKALQVLFKK